MSDFVREGDVLVDKYRVDRVLGQGGMGIVVAAQHLQLEFPVALKLLLPGASTIPEAIGRFLREARAAARIQSEHVVRVSDVGTLDEGTPYMVMELLHGRDLSQLIRSSGGITVTNAIDYLLQASEGVAEAHKIGIVHRDIKPSNLFLTQRSDGSPLIKVLDFGISKAPGSSAASMALTATAAVIGSPMYMSPEQVRSAKDVDGRTDIWSLGVVLHELLAGVPVYKAESPSAVMAMIVADPPAPIRGARPDVPHQVEAVILRCLQKDRTHRFANVAELAMALAPYASPRGRMSADNVAYILRGAGATPMILPPPGRFSSGPPPIATDASWAKSSHTTPHRARAVFIGALVGSAIAATIGIVMVGRNAYHAVADNAVESAVRVEAREPTAPAPAKVAPPSTPFTALPVEVEPSSPPEEMNKADAASAVTETPAPAPQQKLAPRESPPRESPTPAIAPPPAPRKAAPPAPVVNTPRSKPTDNIFDNRTF